MTSRAQHALKDKGFYTGNVDRIYGPKTRRAIRRYQHSNNLRPSGNLDQATVSRLRLRTQREGTGEASRAADQSTANGNLASRKNSSRSVSSDRVRDAQHKPARDGYYNGKINGVMNDGTRMAIRQ
jgi:peptidoglycan hydrolase-like protein with peptidoglycan-binding domain